MNSYSLHQPMFKVPYARTFGVLPLSGLATLGLLLVMVSLVSVDEEMIITEPPPQPIVDIHMPVHRQPENVYEKPDRPEQQETPPPTPFEKPTFTGPQEGGVSLPPFTPPPVQVTGNFHVSDQLMPFIRVQPSYPTRAAERGIEGFVDVVFDVTVMGTTDNIRIVHAEPSTVFNSSVLAAIKRWKYKPKTVEGVAMAAFDVRERITFKLEN